MSLKRITLIVLAAMLLWIPAVLAEEAAAPESFDAIKKAIIEKWGALGAMSAAFDISVQVKINPDMPNPMKLQGAGSTDYRKKDDQTCYRLYTWVGFSEASKMAQLQAVNDGTNLYRDVFVPLAQLRETGQVNASEMVSPDPEALLGLAEEHLNLTGAGSEKVGEQDCYVIEGTFKEQFEKNPVEKIRICFAKETGVPLLITALGEQGVQVGTVTLKDVKVNHDLADSVFKYVPIDIPAPPAPPQSEKSSEKATTAADEK